MNHLPHAYSTCDELVNFTGAGACLNFEPSRSAEKKLEAETGRVLTLWEWKECVKLSADKGSVCQASETVVWFVPRSSHDIPIYVSACHQLVTSVDMIVFTTTLLLLSSQLTNAGLVISLSG